MVGEEVGLVEVQGEVVMDFWWWLFHRGELGWALHAYH